MSKSDFIVVFRPHQRSAWSTTFTSEQHFLDAWINGEFDSSCFADSGRYCRENELEDENYELKRPLTFDDAWSDVRHDLHTLTRIDSREEYEAYIASPGHNKGYSSVRACAQELGWL